MPGQPIEVTRRDLSPATEYLYRVVYRETGNKPFSRGMAHSFRTQRAEGDEFTFTIESDTHVRYSEEAVAWQESTGQLQMKDLSWVTIEKEGADFHINLGDWFEGRVGHCITETTAVYDYIKTKAYQGTRCWPTYFALGNHEGENPTQDAYHLNARSARMKVIPNPDATVSSFYKNPNPYESCQRTACSLAAPTDPLTGQPFAGGIIPANRLSPGGQAYLQLFPLPNTTGTAGNCANWVTSVTTPIRYSQINARIDWSINPTTRLMLRYTQDSWKNESPSLIENLWGDDPFPIVDSTWDQPSRSLTAQLTHELGSTGTNTITFSYSGNAIDVSLGGEDTAVLSNILQKIPTMYPTCHQGLPDRPGGAGDNRHDQGG